MSSRQEEKDRRRAEREAAEQAVARTQARKARLQLGIGAIVAIAAIAIAVVVFSGSKSSDANDAVQSSPGGDVGSVKLPAVKDANLQSAAKTAGCTLLNPPIEGSTHVTTKVTYKNSNPPASGNHNPVPADDGFYDPGNEPAKEHWVHSLEHGRVELQYKPGTPQATINKIEAVANENLSFGREAYKTLVFQNNTGMKEAFAAVAWGHILDCSAFNDSTYDAVRAFRKTYTDKGPELIPPTN
jgi:hypothetical protein